VKLVSLYIENFGGLHRFSLDFEAGITAVMRPNGFGKTTLAEFIRAMFYGFPRRSKTLDRSLRQKYTPWNGGQFGGNLVFELEGQRYRIERTFGANPKGDTVSVTDLGTGRKTKRFPEEIGQELFGLDADSFERSTYLPQLRETGCLATASIQAKLSDLVEDSSDVANFDKAMASLRAQRSALEPYRGSGGRTAETAARITRLQLQLDALQTQEKQLQVAREEVRQAREAVKSTEDRLAHTGARIQEASQQEAAQLQRRQYTQLCSRYSETEETLRACRKKYPRGLPGEDALHRAELAWMRLKQRAEAPAEIRKLPSRQQLDHCRKLCAEHEKLQVRLHDRELQAAELAKAAARHEENGGSRPSKAPLMLVLLGATAAAAGAAAALWVQARFAWPVAGIGAAVLLAGLAAAGIQGVKQRALHRERKRQTRQAEDSLSQLHQQIEALRAEDGKYRREITAFFESCGLPAQAGQDAAALEELERRVLRSEHWEAENGADRAQLQRFFAELGIAPVQEVTVALQQLREDMAALQAAQTLSDTLKAQIADMEETCGETLFEETSAMEDLQQLRREEQQLRAELTAETTRMLQAQETMYRLREAVSGLPAVEEDLEQAQQKLREERERVRLLDETMHFLQQARENLSTAYMGTIRARFGHYLAMLGGGAETFFVDSDLQVRLERQAMAREIAYFSAGQTDLVMLCMRFALVDALFREQEMFLILDDPFVNLDDVHMEQARLLLRKLASERQILYLTCHSGRSI